MADKIDWPRFDVAFADSYCEELGAPGKAMRKKLRRLRTYDGHTPTETLEATESITGVDISDVYVDKGYRGHGCDGSTKVHLAGSSSKKLSRSERKRRRRRSAIEPKIGHLKSDHRVRRCFLSGLEGDAINITLAAAAANLRKLLGGFVLRCVSG